MNRVAAPGVVVDDLGMTLSMAAAAVAKVLPTLGS
jgi:hypothetical protein